MSVRLKFIFLVVLAAAVSSILPIAGSLWEIFNEPQVRPDGKFDNAPDRGAAVFLLILIWPYLLAMSVFLYGLLKYAASKKEKWSSRLYMASSVCGIVFSVVISAFFYRSGLGFITAVFISCFIGFGVLVLPGAVVLDFGEKWV